MTNPKQDIAAVQLSLLPMRDLWKSADSNMRKLKESHKFDLWQWRAENDGSQTRRGRYWKNRNTAWAELRTALRLAKVADIPTTSTAQVLDFYSALHAHHWADCDARRPERLDGQRGECLP